MKPLKTYQLPNKDSPGCFGAIRKHDIHTGVDLYTSENEPVYAIESGMVTKVDIFTGPKLGHFWWNETFAVMVEGKSGIINYGEIYPMVECKDKVEEGDLIGFVIAVLPQGKERPDIVGHSRSMLHIELYKHGTRDFVEWALNEPKPDCLLDPMLLVQ
jgi:murein DD-endopeptidase MepM/ murein hydrolase activator NlpD